jgi:hypothetical protein
MLFLSLLSFFRESGKRNFHLQNGSFYAVYVRRNTEEEKKKELKCVYVCICMYVCMYVCIMYVCIMYVLCMYVYIYRLIKMSLCS